jgi:hypothetical protein
MRNVTRGLPMTEVDGGYQHFSSRAGEKLR